MLIDIDEQADEIFARIEKLPVVLCHRDFWVSNLIYSDGNFALIDWDTSGWGYLGEDLASLIADEPNIDHMVEHYRRCIPVYYKGFSEYADVSRITDHYVYEMILLLFGYRLVEGYLHIEADDEKIPEAQLIWGRLEIGIETPNVADRNNGPYKAEMHRIRGIETFWRMLMILSLSYNVLVSSKKRKGAHYESTRHWRK